jgi:tRNA(Ile2) C34 agmatinyltransferase TiaS
MQVMEMAMKQRSDIEQVKQDAETKRTMIKETNRAQQIELQDASKRYDTELRTSTQANETVMETQTRIEIEKMKAEIALLLASVNKTSLRHTSAETTERAI